MSSLARIPSNIIFQLLSQGTVIVVSFFASPFIVHQLGADLYGVLLIVGLTTGYFGILELGLGQATIKFIAESYEQRSWEDLRQIFWTSALSYLVLSVIGAIGIIVLTPFLVNALSLPQPIRDVTTQVFLISSVGLIISMQVGVASSVPRALERFDLISIVGVALGIGQALLSVILLYFGFSLTGVVIGSTLLQSASLVTYWAIISSILPEVGRPVWSPAKLRVLLRFGSFVTVSQVVNPLLHHLEKFILGGMVSVAVVTYYTVPYNFLYALTFLPASISTATYPAFIRMNVANETERLKELYLRSTKYVFMALFPVALMMLLYGREFLTAWMGAEFGAQGAAALQILAFALVINTLAWPSFQLLQALGRPEVAARFHLIELFIHIPSCLILIFYFGLIGAAAALTARVLIDTALLSRAVRRLINIESSEFLRKCLLRVFIVAILLLPSAALLKLCSIGFDRFAMLCWIAIVGGCYWLAVLSLSLDKTDKTYLSALMKRYRHRFGFEERVLLKSKS